MSFPGSAAETRLPIAVLAPDPKNPRRISEEAARGLATSMEVFGALDIVFNETTGELVSGHQRVAQLKAAGATEVVREGDRGHIVHPKTGERFVVRFVDWDAVTQRKANIAANNPHIAGTFTPLAIEQLTELSGDIDFQPLQFDALLSGMDIKPPEFPEFGEDAADDVKFVECPACGHKFPK